jgi:hypothetical protein
VDVMRATLLLISNVASIPVVTAAIIMA